MTATSSCRNVSYQLEDKARTRHDFEFYGDDHSTISRIFQNLLSTFCQLLIFSSNLFPFLTMSPGSYALIILFVGYYRSSTICAEWIGCGTLSLRLLFSKYLLGHVYVFGCTYVVDIESVCMYVCVFL